nr:hypothetical protein [uncultured Prevotella sp.]
MNQNLIASCFHTGVILSCAERPHHWCEPLAPLVRSISTSLEDTKNDSLWLLHYMYKMLMNNLCGICRIDNRNRL